MTIEEESVANNYGQKLEKIFKAIIIAYPNKIDLEMMLKFKLGENLNSIAGGEDIQEIVFNLIKWAESHNNLEELIEAVCEYNPDNQELQIIRGEIKL